MGENIGCTTQSYIHLAFIGEVERHVFATVGIIIMERVSCHSHYKLSKNLAENEKKIKQTFWDLL